jgi:hypothetical protein
MMRVTMTDRRFANGIALSKGVRNLMTQKA